ncbi:glycosyltransferase family 2 protein [Aequorivita sp. 609]|uniref:glycosyltransferase family 2 protein n=1 Tax=Aequorivita TaxID=153265 RepID=UPI00160F1CC1|nr:MULTISPECIES: glycosyltransferase family 2 protein [Aequorivita]MBB6681544.1 glycosyltransferase family 2 protein [Aequorivita sp. 609]
MKKPLVSILCITYNHQQFIGKCLESLTNQKCDFDFEILIHDDASTDGTQAIIKGFQQKYPEIVKPILQTENQWSKKAGGINLRFNYPRAKGKYLALCDGDDFWIDEKKLQKQVTFLENNPDFSLVCGAYMRVQDGKKTPVIRTNKVSPEKNEDKGSQFDLEDHNKAWFSLIRPSSVLFRNYAEQVKLLKEYEFSFDIHLFYHLLKIGKGYYSNEILVGYNVHKSGVNSGTDHRDRLLFQYYLVKEIYEKDKNSFSKQRYLKICFKIINLKISGLMPNSKIKTPQLRNKTITTRQIIREIKPLMNSEKERKEFYKCFIPLQLKILKSELKKKMSISK